MKHLFASCAVVALMAAPALAQSTTPPNDPFADTNVVVDPTMPEEPDVSVDAVVESETDVSVSMAPETEADAEVVAEAGPDVSLDTDKLAETETEEAADPAFQAEVEATDTDVDIVADVESVDAPVDLAELPQEYSTDDLNALMLAQLNDKAEEIAEISFVSQAETFASSDTSVEVSEGVDAYASDETVASVVAPTEDYAANQMETSVTPEPDSYASAETDTQFRTQSYAGTETETEAAPQSHLAMTDTAPTEESAVQDYASSATGTYVRPETGAVTPDLAPSDEAAIEDYAANEANGLPEGAPITSQANDAMVPVDPALKDNTAEMAEESGETTLMSEEEDGNVMIAQGDIDQNAVEIATGDARFSTLVELVSIAGLEDELAMDGPYTIFAPTNEAFAALPDETLARLKSEEGKEELVEILKAHVVEGAVMASDVPLVGQEVETLADTTASVTGSIDGSLNIKGSNTIGDGIYASNGVVYAIDTVILPEADLKPVVDDTEN